ncbi:MAG: cyclic nucleotide-binding domain-containing protein, partial [Verrucomicrobiales bacterium]
MEKTAPSPGLTREACAWTLGAVDTKTFDAGEVIFREGDDSEEAYRILEGEVEISLRTPYGPRVLSHLHRGEIFGEMGLANELPRSATATARKSTNVEIITAENF